MPGDMKWLAETHPLHSPVKAARQAGLFCVFSVLTMCRLLCWV